VYQSFYKLTDHPFRLTPDPAYIYMTAQHREALAGLVYSACTRPGLSVLVGEAGTGKTTLITTLLGLLERRRFISAVCNNPTLTREEFYDLVLVKLGVECASTLKSRQLIALQDALVRNRAEGRPSVLIVDEAHKLPTELLEEVRLLLNLETPREKLLEIILAGQPELTDILGRPELRQFKQRVSCICRIQPLSLTGVREYINHRLLKAGLPEQTLFSDVTIEAIYQYTQGIPRLVNTLCNSALQLGLASRSSWITVPIVREAAKDLDLLPSATVSDLVPEIEAALALAGIPDVAHASGVNGNGVDMVQSRVPLENYAARQKSLGFIANLMDRLR
jgi:general secretion pathway protein A